MSVRVRVRGEGDGDAEGIIKTGIRWTLRCFFENIFGQDVYENYGSKVGLVGVPEGGLV